MAIEYGGLPFKEAVDYLQGKVNLPTKSWTEIWQGEHTKAFTVAGATKDELLTDLHQSINTAIKDGMTLDQFRKEFDTIVARHNWPYKGGRNWRTRIIYETNMRTAYQAGRYQQQQAVKARRPYWQYDHSDFVTHPRPEHEAWDGLVLSADDPWWDTHYPPNDWGCHCSVRALSQRDLKRLGKEGPDIAPLRN
ncbi:MAG: phage minor head protein [Halioglobus sp.]